MSPGIKSALVTAVGDLWILRETGHVHCFSFLTRLSIIL